MKLMLLLMLIIIGLVANSDAAILIKHASGAITTTETLESARTSPSLSGTTVIVTSNLTPAQSDILSAWPIDRALRVENGGSINNTTNFTVTSSFEAGLYSVFVGSGDVVIKSAPAIQGKWFGMVDDCSGKTGTDNSAALNKAILVASQSRIPLETNGATYLVNKPIYLKSNLTWRGNGTIRSYINGSKYNRVITTEDDGVSVAYTLEHVKISNMRFEKYQDTISGPYHFLIIHNANDLEFNGCYFHGNISRLKDVNLGGKLTMSGITIGISPFDQFVKLSKNIRFVNNLVEQGWNAGFQVGTVDNVSVIGNQFIDCIARGVDIEVSNSDDITQAITVSGNTFRLTENVDGGGITAAQIVINEYYVKAPIEKGANNPENQWISISGNTFFGERPNLTSNGAAIQARGGTGVIISGNTGYKMHSTSNASLITGSSIAKTPSKPQYYSIIGNAFDGKMQITNLVHSSIVGNVIKNGGYDYALIESGTSFDNTYVGNMFEAGRSGTWFFSDKREPLSTRIGNINSIGSSDIISFGSTVPLKPFITETGQLFFRTGGTGHIYAYNISDNEWVGLNMTPSTTRKGPVYQASAQPASTATDLETLKADFNNLLNKLRKAKILAP